MRKFSKIFAILLAIFMVISLTACGSITNFNDFASNAQQDAENMANDIKNELDKWGQMEGEIGDWLNGDTTTNAPENASGPYKVKRVVDGDTFIVDIDGKETKVRLIGVDTPESVATGDNAHKNCEEGKSASNFTKDTIEGKNVYIEYDIDPNDDYGRTLAYVYLQDGRMLNKLLLEMGYARLMTIQPNVKYVDEFTAIQKTARENQIGFWENFDQWQE